MGNVWFLITAHVTGTRQEMLSDLFHSKVLLVCLHQDNFVLRPCFTLPPQKAGPLGNCSCLQVSVQHLKRACFCKLQAEKVIPHSHKTAFICWAVLVRIHIVSLPKT